MWQNLAGLGVRAVLAGFVGADEDGAELRSLLGKIDGSLLTDGSLPTISKTRIVGRTQQMLRLDVESREPATKGDAARLVEAVKAQIG